MAIGIVHNTLSMPIAEYSFASGVYQSGQRLWYNKHSDEIGLTGELQGNNAHIVIPPGMYQIFVNISAKEIDGSRTWCILRYNKDDGTSPILAENIDYGHYTNVTIPRIFTVHEEVKLFIYFNSGANLNADGYSTSSLTIMKLR